MRRNTFARLLFITLLSCFGTAQANSSMPPENGNCLADSYIRVTSTLAMFQWPDIGAPAYRVERRRIDHSAFEVLATTPHLIGGYIDQTVELFVTYEYRIGVLDEQGSIVCWSPMLHATPTPRHPPKLPPVINSQPPETALVGQLYTYAIEATDPNSMPLTYRLDRSPIGMSLDTQTGLLEWVPGQSQVGSHPISFSVIDIAGHSVRQSFDIAVDAITEDDDNSITLPPNPEDVAPPLPGNVVSVQEQTAFLYTGPNPIQTGVAPNTIEERRAAVVRGQVLDRSNNPLSGVTITIKDSGQYGQTLSRQDGWFDLTVNGGGMLIVNYEKTGFLPVQRQVNPQWNAFAFAEDVVMIQLDPQVTTVQLGNGAPMQVAQGSPQTDSEGTRQATVLFPQGTTATMRLPNGSTQALTTLNVRATEYTVGDNGFEAMPGPLPPTSAYTYAVELSVDEAIAAGASRVDFNQPVPLYVDNFLNFPTGEIVPAGYYDFDDAVWKAGDNGRVIEILSIENGLAVLDTEGQGQAATEDELLELGINEEELQTLATLYTTGSTLWRTPISHFTPWDCNWPSGPPMDAKRPNVPKPETFDRYQPDNSNEEDKCAGCVISPQRQTLGESLPVAGTPFELVYRSDRTRGYLNNIADITLSGDSVPSSLQRIRLTVYVAGRRYIRYFSKMPNQQHRFEWDGIDAYGREVYGTHLATVSIHYEYPCVYYAARSERERAWARVGNSDQVIGTRDDCQSINLIQTHLVKLVSPNKKNSNSVGSWSLSIHHAVDITNNTLLLGNGERVPNVGTLIDTIAGSGSAGSTGGFSGDGGQARDAELNDPMSVVVDSKGNLYVADSTNNRIRRINTNGTIDTVAGSGSSGTWAGGFAGDGGTATTALLHYPRGIAMDDSGNLYISDSLNHRIRRVSPNGIIDTVAGSGDTGTTSGGFSGDGGQATLAQLDQPRGIAVDSMGNLYIADQGNNRIRMVSPDGIIETIAGSGPSGAWDSRFSGDGGPATSARLATPNDVAMDSLGNLFIADTLNRRVRMVSPDGIIETVAGSGPRGSNNFAISFAGDGGPATEAITVPVALTVDAVGNIYIVGNNRLRQVSNNGIIRTIAGRGVNGFSGDGGPAVDARTHGLASVALDAGDSFYIADSGNNRIRRVRLSLTTPTTEGEIQTASADGTQLFHFDRYGQHLKTTDTVTGVVLYTFAYDANNLLSTVTDQHGNVTQIERNGLGHATAIIAPQGQRTELTVNANGHLTRLSNPNGESWHMNYTGRGLLTRFETPNGHVNTFQYNEYGRLVRDIAPNGGGWQIFRTGLLQGYTTSMISGEGRASHFTVQDNSSGQRFYTNEAPDGSITKRRHTDAETILIQPTGTQITSTQTPDPRFGMHAPVASQSITTPGGLTLNQTTERSAQLEDANDALSHTALTTTVTVNDRVQTSAYDAASRTWTHTSPEGRTLTQRLNELGLLSESRIEGLADVRYQYDNQGRLTQVARGAGNQRAIDFGYDTFGYLNSLTDALGKTVHYQNDAVGRVLQQTNPNGTTVDYDYDANGNLSEIRLPKGEVHRFVYDTADQQTGYTPPNPNNGHTDAPVGGTHPTTLYAFNRDKQLVAVTRPDGVVLDYAYHASTGQLDRLSIPEGDYTFAYYGADDVYHSGQLKTLTAPGGQQTAYEYDGFLLTGNTWSGDVSGSVGYEYNHYFEPTRQLLNGVAVDWQFNADSQLTQVGDLNLHYSPTHGMPTSTQLGSLTTGQSYNELGELTDYSASQYGSVLYHYALHRNSVGRIVGKTETVNGVSSEFTYHYDQNDRLTQVLKNSISVQSWQYDTHGNRTHENGSLVATYDAQDRLLQYGDNQYHYTANGELTRKTNSNTGDVTFYDYDAFSNLRSVTLPDSTHIEYVIDGQNRRVGKKRNGVLEQGFLYQGQLNPVAELDGNNNVIARFIYGDKGHVPSYMIKHGINYRIVSDHLGSVRLVVNTSTGDIAQRMDYDAWGNVTNDTNPGFQPFGYAGGIYDRDTQLVRFGARDYDPQTGRWTTKDPIGFGGGFNHYAYVENDPVNFIDPNGLWSFSLNLYLGVGGGITIGQNDRTGQWFGGGRLGLGIGGGAGLDMMDNGPTARRLRPSPYAEPCPSLSAGLHGTSAGSFFWLGASAGLINYGLSAQGGYHFDGTGASYSEGPTIGPSMNLAGTASSNLNASIGGFMGIEVLGW